MLIGGKSRAVVAPAPEYSRFISLCIRRSSMKGSKPSLGNSESAMISPPLHVHPDDARGSRPAGTQENAGAPDGADRTAANMRPAGGGVGNDSDHISTTK